MNKKFRISIITLSRPFKLMSNENVQIVSACRISCVTSVKLLVTLNNAVGSTLCSAEGRDVGHFHYVWAEWETVERWPWRVATPLRIRKYVYLTSSNKRTLFLWKSISHINYRYNAICWTKSDESYFFSHKIQSPYRIVERSVSRIKCCGIWYSSDNKSLCPAIKRQFLQCMVQRICIA